MPPKKKKLKPKPKPKLKPRIGTWDTTAALTQVQLLELIQDSQVKKYVFVEEPDEGFWLEIHLVNRKTPKYLTTKRAVGEPRFYKRIDVLKRHLRDQYKVLGLWRLNVEIR